MRGHPIHTLLTCALVLSLVATLGLTAVAPAQAQSAADLEIEQPTYIDTDVSVTSADGERVYEARGDELLIRFLNADHANVTSVTVQDGPGSIEYDEGLDLYRFDTNEQAGTTEVVFRVDEGGTTTEYRALIQVEDVHWTTRTAEADAELREEAELWQDVESEALEVNPDQDPQETVSSGLTWVRFLDNPFASFFADIQAILIMMVFRPGGWFTLAVFLGIALIGAASGARYRNRTQKQLAEWGDIRHEKDEAFLQKVRRTVLQQNDWNQLFPDDVARANREYFGRNLWQGARNFSLLWSPRSTKGTILQMMGQVGYAGYVVRDSDENVREAGVLDEGDSLDDVATDGGTAADAVDLTTLDFEDDAAFIDAVAWEHLDDGVFDADRDAIDIDEVRLPISNREIDDAEFMETVNPHFPDDYEDEEDFAEACGQILQFVVEHPNTDELGRMEPEMDLVSYLSEMTTWLADEAGFPVAHFQRQVFFWVAENLQSDDEISETVERVNRSGVGGDPAGGGST